MKKLLILSMFILAGCATPGENRADQNKMIKEFYASVTSMQPVELSSEVKTGIVGGAVVGVLENLDGDREDMIAGGIVGGLVGGFFTALFEGSNQAYQYSLHAHQQGAFTVIQKEEINIQSQCVKVRVADEVQLSAALAENCRF